jgi:hypothetical protein
MTVQQSALVLAWIVIALLSVGFAAIARQVVALTRLAELASVPPGARRGPIVGLRLPVTSRIAAMTGSPLMAIFVAPGCSSCTQLLAECSISSAVRESGLEIVAVSTGNCPVPDSWPSHWTCLERASDEHDLFSVPATPFVALVDPSSTVTLGVLVRGIADVEGVIADYKTDIAISGVEQ